MDWNKLTEEILKRIDTIAAKLGVAAAELWKILVRQAIIEGVWFVFLALFMGTISFFLLKYGLTTWLVKWESLAKEQSSYGSKEVPDRILTATIVSIIIGTLTGVAALGLAHDALLALGNPTYYALSKLLEVARGQ